MGKPNLSKWITWISARSASVVAVGVLLCATTSTPAAPRVKRAAPEVAVGGMTRAERITRHEKMHARLMAEMLNGALKNPISVELTRQDRADLALPHESGTPLRIGIVKDIAPRVVVARGDGLNRGAMRETRDGGFVWSMSVTSPGAKAIRVHFTDFSLPLNAKMYFFSPEGAADGPYVTTSRNENGYFWTRSISSDTGVIQLRFSGKGARRARPQISFVVSELAHIYGRQHLEPEAASHDSWPCSDVSLQPSAMWRSGSGGSWPVAT